jgi:chemotaxis-related protein WspD
MARHLPIFENGASCWSTIGVFSRDPPSCPTLEQVVHCQNCEVYSAAGRTLFERAAPSDYTDEWTRALRLGKRTEQVESMSLLVFRIGTEWLGLPTPALSQVSDVKRIHSLPHRSDEILLGLVNVRGRIHLCCSLAALLGITASDAAPGPGSLAYRRMIVVASASERWVLPVDEIDGVRRFRPRHVRDTPVTVAKDRSHFTRHVVEFDEDVLLHSERGEGATALSGKQIGCLDPDRVFEALRRHVFLVGGDDPAAQARG